MIQDKIPGPENRITIPFETILNIHAYLCKVEEKTQPIKDSITLLEAHIFALVQNIKTGPTNVNQP